MTAGRAWWIDDPPRHLNDGKDPWRNSEPHVERGPPERGHLPRRNRERLLRDAVREILGQAAAEDR